MRWKVKILYTNHFHKSRPESEFKQDINRDEDSGSAQVADRIRDCTQSGISRTSLSYELQIG